MNQLERTISSLEVAEMVGRRHDQVLRDIKTIIDHLGDDHKNVGNYFIEDTYKDNLNRTKLCYQLTKKGCELYGTRMTGAKGTQFAVKYIERFNEMEQTLLQPQTEDAKLAIQRMRAEAMLNNSRTRQAKLILDMQKNKTLSPVAVELLHLNALEVLGDKPIEHRPEVQKSYTATEIAKVFGVSAQKIGSLANKHNLKTDEYGYFALDKSRYSNKQVESFRYYESGKQKIGELLGK